MSITLPDHFNPHDWQIFDEHTVRTLLKLGFRVNTCRGPAEDTLDVDEYDLIDIETRDWQWPGECKRIDTMQLTARVGTAGATWLTSHDLEMDDINRDLNRDKVDGTWYVSMMLYRDGVLCVDSDMAHIAWFLKEPRRSKWFANPEPLSSEQHICRVIREVEREMNTTNDINRDYYELDDGLQSVTGDTKIPEYLFSESVMREQINWLQSCIHTKHMIDQAESPEL